MWKCVPLPSYPQIRENVWNNHGHKAHTVGANITPNPSTGLQTSFTVLLHGTTGIPGLGVFPRLVFFIQSEQFNNAHQKNHSCILWFGQVLILTWCNESRWAHIRTPDKCVPLHMFHCSIWRTQYYSPQHFRKILQNLGKKNILRLIQPAVEKSSYYSKDFWKISLTCHMICCYRHMKTYIWLNFCRIILSNALPSFCVNAMCAKSSDVSLFQTEWQWKRYDAVQNLLCRKRST